MKNYNSFYNSFMTRENAETMEAFIASLKTLGLKRVRRTGHNTVRVAGVTISLLFDGHAVRFERRLPSGNYVVEYTRSASHFASTLRQFKLI